MRERPKTSKIIVTLLYYYSLYNIKFQVMKSQKSCLWLIFRLEL